MNIINTGAALALTTTLASAGGFTMYDDHAVFSMNTGALSIENFESEQLGDLALPTGFDSGLGLSMGSGAVSSYIGAGDPDNFGFENTTAMGRNYLAFGRNVMVPGAPDMPQTGSYTAVFSLGESVNAFGFNLSGAEFAFAAMGLNVTTFSNGQIRDDFFFASDQFFGVDFYGMITDDSFDTISINIPVLTGGTADYVAFDDVTWGAVPAPSTPALLALGGLGATRRRR